MKYYYRYPADITIKTGHLTPAEMGCYDRLMDHYYSKELPVPEHRVHSICRAITTEDQQACNNVLAEFFELTPEGWIQQRIDEEIGKAQKRITAARENGKLGGRPPKAKPTGFSPETQEESETEAGDKAAQTSTSSTKKNPPTPRKRGKATEPQGLRFEEFWLAWPKNERKQDRAKCWDHWRRNGLDAQAEAILADVRTKRGTTKWQEGFVEAPLVYLRGKRWEDGVTPDEPKPAQPGAPTAGGSGAPDASATAQMLAEQAARPATKPPAALRQLLPRRAA